MLKYEFLLKLGDALSGLPSKEIEQSVTFYGEMIEDRMEEGLTEEEAVASLGNVEEVAEQIMSETPLAKIVKERIKPQKQLGVLTIVLLILGSPIWVSLLAAALVVLLVVLVVIWSSIASCWAVFGALVGGAIGSIVAAVVFMCCESAVTGLAMIGIGLAAAGLCILWFYVCLQITKGVAWVIKKAVQGVKKTFAKKESTK